MICIVFKGWLKVAVYGVSKKTSTLNPPKTQLINDTMQSHLQDLWSPLPSFIPPRAFHTTPLAAFVAVAIGQRLWQGAAQLAVGFGHANGLPSAEAELWALVRVSTGSWSSKSIAFTGPKEIQPRVLVSVFIHFSRSLCVGCVFISRPSCARKEEAKKTAALQNSSSLFSQVAIQLGVVRGAIHLSSDETESLKEKKAEVPSKALHWILANPHGAEKQKNLPPKPIETQTTSQKKVLKLQNSPISSISNPKNTPKMHKRHPKSPKKNTPKQMNIQKQKKGLLLPPTPPPHRPQSQNPRRVPGKSPDNFAQVIAGHLDSQPLGLEAFCLEGFLC